MGILSDYLAAALRSATYRLGEGGYVEASVPKLGLQTRAPNFEECRNRLADELERWLARVLLAHEQIPELGGVEAPLQELALSVDPLSNPTEQAILQHVRTLLEEVRTLRKSLQPTPPPKEAPKSIPRVTDYLASLGLGLQVARNGLPEGEERFLDRVSLFLGERFHQLAGLYEKLKASAAKGGGDFQYSLKEASQQEIGSSTQFCTILKENGLLQNYRYNSTQRRIYARLSGEGKVHNFITGGWLERYVRQEVLSVVRRKNVPYDLVANPLLVYPKKWKEQKQHGTKDQIK
jgi:hypothetical protein